MLWWLAWPAIAFLLLSPLPIAMPGRADLAAHFLLFGGMAFAAVGFAHRPRSLLLMAAVTVALGAGFELVQAHLPYRSAGAADVLANALGSACGCALALALCRYLIWPAAADRGLGLSARA